MIGYVNPLNAQQSIFHVQSFFAHNNLNILVLDKIVRQSTEYSTSASPALTLSSVTPGLVIVSKASNVCFITCWERQLSLRVEDNGPVSAPCGASRGTRVVTDAPNPGPAVAHVDFWIGKISKTS